MINFGEGMIGSGASHLMQCQGEAAAGRPAPNNFQPFQQPQTTGAGQQMQTTITTTPYPFYGNPQDPQISSIQNPGTGYHFHRPEVPSGNYQRGTATFAAPNPCQPVFQTGCNPGGISVQGRPYTSETLPQNILEQIRGYVTGTAAPIFILPAGCHQFGPGHQQGQQQPIPQPAQGPPTSVCPPTFYPYPVAMPVYTQPYGEYPAREARYQDVCVCSRQRSPDLPMDLGNFGQTSGGHRCTDTQGEAICTKRDCPASITLQALASQLLSQPGIISCAATRMILKKIPGSNIGTSIEETMERAQRSIDGLTKEQLLAESRIGQQTTCLINHHMTANPPANVIPVLTLVQLKVNLLKARVENLINKKIMENQGWCPELEAADLIDPAILNMKSDPELRQLVSALRQKECDERVNLNFAPYHSQRLLAESRLRVVQNKIAQIEAEFERRRCLREGLTQAPTLTSRIVKQFSESYCTYGMPDSRLFDIPQAYRRMESPDPFSVRVASPRRLWLKGCEPGPGTSQQSPAASNRSTDRATCTEPSRTDDKQTGDGEEEASCGYCTDRSTSEESLEQVKKKLRIASHGLDGPAVERRVVAERDHHPVEDRIERSSVYIEVRPDKERWSVPRQISRSNTADLDTIQAEIGLDRVQLSGTKRQAEDHGGLDSDRSTGKQTGTGTEGRKFETGSDQTETERPLTDEPSSQAEASEYAEFAVKETTTATTRTTTGLRGGGPFSPRDSQETDKTTGLRIEPKPESLLGAEEAGQEVTASENATTRQTAEALYTSSFEIKWRPRKTRDRDNRAAYLLNKADSGGVTGLINKKAERRKETEEIVSMLSTVRYNARPADEIWEKVVGRGGSGGWLHPKNPNISNGAVYSAGNNVARSNDPEQVFHGEKHEAQSTFNVIDEPYRESLANLARPGHKCPGWKSSGPGREARTGSGPEERSPGKESAEEAARGGFNPRRYELGRLVRRTWARIADRLAVVGSLVADTITRAILSGLNRRRMLPWFDSEEELPVSRWPSTRHSKRIPLRRERVAVGEGERDNARSLRRAILLNGEGPNYTVIRGLIWDPDGAGSVPARIPYKIRSSFLITGRLKGGRVLTEKTGGPQPFTVFKRSGRTVVVSGGRTVACPYADAEHELRRSEKFWSLRVARRTEKIRRSISPPSRRGSGNSTRDNAIPVLAKYAGRGKTCKNSSYRWPVSRFSSSADRLTNVRCC